MKSILSQKPIWAQNLRKARELAKMTQKEVAELLFKSQWAYCIYEQGKCEPSIESWKIIWDLFKISDPKKFWTADYYVEEAA